MRVREKYINPFTDFGFKKLFEQAELASYTDQEYAEYGESLKVYRDLKNVIDTAFDEGKAEGVAEGIRLTALRLKREGLALELIAKVTGLNLDDIGKL